MSKKIVKKTFNTKNDLNDKELRCGEKINNAR